MNTMCPMNALIAEYHGTRNHDVDLGSRHKRPSTDHSIHEVLYYPKREELYVSDISTVKESVSFLASSFRFFAQQ